MATNGETQSNFENKGARDASIIYTNLLTSLLWKMYIRGLMITPNFANKRARDAVMIDKLIPNIASMQRIA